MLPLFHIQKSYPRQHLRLSLCRVAPIWAGVLSLAVLFAGCGGQSANLAESRATAPAICLDCTHTISGYDATVYSFSGSEVLCITASGHFSGRINRATATGEIRICNEGLFEPTSISLYAGSMQIDNYGIFRPGIINLNPGVARTVINNFEEAEFKPGAFNLHEAGSVFNNYGSFSPARFSMARGALFINHPSGNTTTDVFSMRHDAKAINRGTWTLSGTLDRDTSTSLENEGSLQMTGNPR
jgi:hypothetical protein